VLLVSIKVGDDLVEEKSQSGRSGMSATSIHGF